MILVCLLPWCIPTCALSTSCLPIVLPLAFLLFQSPFWAFSSVLWIFDILIDNAPLFLFHIRISNMVCSWYQSDGGSDLVRNGLSVVVRFLPPGFDLRFHYTVLDQTLCVFLSWFGVMDSRSWCSHSIYWATSLLFWCISLLLTSIACSRVFDSTLDLSLPSLLLHLHAHFLRFQHGLVSTLFRFEIIVAVVLIFRCRVLLYY